MASFQQKLMLKGSDESIDYFTKVLKDVKDKAGFSTASAIVEALENWETTGIPSAKCEALERQGKVRSLPLALLCSADVHVRVNSSMERIKRDNTMCLVMIRNKAGKEEWLLEALIVTMEFFLNSSTLENTNVITRSDGLRCAVKELRGMSEVRISSDGCTEEKPKAENKECEIKKEQNISQISRGQSCGREQSCPPTTSWRSRLVQDQEIDKPMIKAEKKVVTEKKEQRRSSKTHERRKRLDTITSESESEDTSFKRRKRKGKIPMNSNSPPPVKKSAAAEGLRYDIAFIAPPIRTSRDRKEAAHEVSKYLNVLTPEEREMPGFEGKLGKWERHRHGVDCDEVFPGIVLGNGATVKKKEYLKSIGISHILNAAEFRGVNVGEDFYTSSFKYKGLRVEDTPQTQICRHFMEIAQFLDSALSSNGKCFVNCVFGRSRSTTCVVVYLMLKHDWEALKALEHIRKFRAVEVNEGFLQQLADLDFKLKWYKKELEEERKRKEQRQVVGEAA
eukprot:GFUD01044493.1.p1 GENE.GFUD01044493.1~~GFUD01044493.1.p1  ORF type:complete len:524 (+),score=169.43 GFUD01044493.1:52-1572(+)